MGTEFILKQDGITPGLWELEYSLDGIPAEAFLTFGEIVDDIVANRLGSGAEEDIIGCAEEELWRLHHSFGRWIRNSYGLWLESNPLTNNDQSYVCDGIDHNPKHPDSVSFDIIREVYSRLIENRQLHNNFDNAMETVAQENTHDAD